MKRNKTIKIKRSKSRLYKKKKSTAKVAAETIVFVLIAGALVFVGYAAAGPIINYLSTEDSGTVTDWTPEESSQPEEIDPQATDTQPDEVTAEEEVSQGLGSYLLSESALSNQSTLTAQLKNAKEMGFKEVIIPLKQNSGDFLYKSNISYIKDTDLIKGSMPAGQIISAAKAQGLTAKALIPTLMDANSPSYAEDTGYRFADDSYGWLDAAAANGGKRWIDPFLDGTKKYYGDIAKELIGAGFEEVVLAQVRFPAFWDDDKKWLDARNFTETRYTELTAFYNSVYNASGQKTSVEIDINDVLNGYGESFESTAEILKDKNFTGTVYLRVNPDDFPENRLEVGENKFMGLSPDTVNKTKTLVNKAAEYIGTNVTVVPVIVTDGLTEEEVTGCYKALAVQ